MQRDAAALWRQTTKPGQLGARRVLLIQGGGRAVDGRS